MKLKGFGYHTPTQRRNSANNLTRFKQAAFAHTMKLYSHLLHHAVQFYCWKVKIANETPTCNISKNSTMTKVLQQFKLIVWDECTLAHKKSLKTLIWTMRDLQTIQIDSWNDFNFKKFLSNIASDSTVYDSKQMNLVHDREFPFCGKTFINYTKFTQKYPGPVT